MNTFIMTMGYIFIGILIFCIICCIIYWVYQLYKYFRFSFKYYRFTPTYFYKITHEGKWQDAYWNDGKSYIEHYCVKRRKRYHIFSKFETLFKLNTEYDADSFLNNHIKMFPD